MNASDAVAPCTLLHGGRGCVRSLCASTRVAAQYRSPPVRRPLCGAHAHAARPPPNALGDRVAAPARIFRKRPFTPWSLTHIAWPIDGARTPRGASPGRCAASSSRSSPSPCEGQCGWCKDRWGLSWQITPRALTDAPAAGGGEAKRVFDAMMPVKKIDVATIEAARGADAREDGLRH